MSAFSNETTLTIGEKSVPLRANMTALVNLEAKTGKKLAQLVKDCGAMELSIVDLIVLMMEGSKAAEHPLTEEDVIILVEDYGIATLQVELAEFFTIALYGGKKAAAEAAKKKTQTKKQK